MTPLAYDMFIEWYPEFEDVPSGAVTRQLDLSNMTLSEHAWGKWWNQACGLFTAHYLAIRYNISDALHANGIRSATASVGVTTNKSATTSGITEGSAVSGLITGDNPIGADFGRTSYGLEYLSLMDMIIPSGNVIFSPSASAVAGIRRF